jgi:hypothetical protein
MDSMKLCFEVDKKGKVFMQMRIFFGMGNDEGSGENVNSNHFLDFHRQSTVTFHHAEHFKNIFPISRDI